MPQRLKSLYRKLGRIEKVFLILLILNASAALFHPGPGISALIGLLFYIAAVVVAFRLSRLLIKRLIWRLRNRLIVAYLFIAVVPIVLILALAGIATYMIAGQVAVYLVSSELARWTASLSNAAEVLSRTAEANQPEAIRRMSALLAERFPEVEVFIRDDPHYRYPANSPLRHPPGEWKDSSGVVLKEGRPFAWAHAKSKTSEVTLAAPLSHDYLTGLVPGLGDVSFLNLTEAPARAGAPALTYGRRSVQLDHVAGRRVDRVPPKYIPLDIQVTGVYPMSAARWDSPDSNFNVLLVVHTRTSAVLQIVFGQKMDWAQMALGIFVAVAILFLIVEMISLVIGISLTRTITRAVHGLYEGTQKVKEGDFAHRIPVHGRDQLAELTISFNTMTENLERLIVVAKEKERMQSELEIAREVQNQLFPKNVPYLKSFQITGVCNPARMVSGDYYDFILTDHSMAFAIGDVAGKGISAALLMAAIQSTMRTQLSAGVPVAMAAGNGANSVRISTATLVSHLNKQLYATTSPEKYATFYFGIYDDASHILTYTNAGHLPPILLRDGNPCPLEVTGTVVGAFPFSRYDEKQVSLAAGDLLVAYTDGIVEPENEYGEMFGEDRLKDLLVKHADLESDEIIARVMEAVRQWTGAGELQDDMTILVARRL